MNLNKDLNIQEFNITLRIIKQFKSELQESFLCTFFHLSPSNFIVRRTKGAKNETGTLNRSLHNNEEYTAGVEVTETLRETEQITLEFIIAKKGIRLQSKMSISGCLAVHRRYKTISEPSLKSKVGQGIITVAITNEEEMRETAHE